MFGIFGHGCVVGIGQALEQGGHSLTYYQGHNEQGMAHAAMAYAKQNRRRKIIACTSSIGPGALNMVTAAGTATANLSRCCSCRAIPLPAASRTLCSSRLSRRLL